MDAHSKKTAWQLPSLYSVWIVLTILVSWVLVYASAKQEVRIIALVPEHAFHRRSYKSAVKRTAADLSRDWSLRLTENYTISGSTVDIKVYSPPELLQVFCDSILETHVNAIFFLSDDSQDSTASAQYLLQISNYLGIPVIAWIGDNAGVIQSSAESAILQMTPSISHQCRAMLSLLQRYDWQTFSIVTGSIVGQDNFINTLRDLVDKSTDHTYEILSVIKIASMESKVIEAQLKKLADTRVILFYASIKEAEKIFESAIKMGLTSKEYVWVVSKTIVGSSGLPPDGYPYGLLGINYETEMSMRTEALQNGVKVWVQAMESIVIAAEPNVNTQDLMIPNLSCSSQLQTWKGGYTLFNHMKNVSFESIAFNEDGTMTDTELKIVNLNMENDWKEIGDWSAVDGLTISDITWPGDASTPPQGRPAKYHLKVVTLEEKPYVVYSDTDPKTGVCPPQADLCRVAPLNETMHVANATTNSSLYKCCSGFCIDLLRKLSEKMGFVYDLFEVEDGNWGAYDKELKEWNGLVRTIMDGKADMVMTSLKITPERNAKIEFSVPFLETGITIIVAVRDGVISPTAFLEPFDIMSWLFILLMCIHVVAIIIFLFEWMSPYGYNLARLPPREPYDYPSWCLILVFSVHASGAAIFVFEWLSPSGLDRGNKPIREHRFSLFRSFWLIWAMLFGAAVNVDNPRGVSSRFLANIWALFAVVFTASYTANLAAFMITKEDYDRLSGIKDWRLVNPYAHKPPFKFATIPHGSTETNLRNNYPDMYQYMRPYNKTNVKDGVRAVKDGEINAFIYDATVLEYLAAHDDSCKLRTVGSWYAMTGYGVGFPKGSKWIQHVNKHILQIAYDGGMERLQNFWLAGACKKGDEEGESSQPLGILNFTSAFILLAGGMLLGGSLLLLEHIYFKFFRVKLRRWDRCGCCGLVSLSMGKSLTFEQSVREAIDMQKHHKCKNAVCETQVWKLKHELDLALLKIDKLNKQMGDLGVSADKKGVWKDPRREKNPTLPIGWKAEVLPTEYPSKSSRAWQADGGEPPPPFSGPPYPVDTAFYPPPLPNVPSIQQTPVLEQPAENLQWISETSDPVPGRKEVLERALSRDSCKSLPNSPMKVTLTGLSRVDSMPEEKEPLIMQPQDIGSSDIGGGVASTDTDGDEELTSGGPGDPPLGSSDTKTGSAPVRRTTNSTKDQLDKTDTADKKTKFHKGHVYEGIDDEAPMEKETCL